MKKSLLLPAVFLFLFSTVSGQKYGWLQTIKPGGNEYTWDITTDIAGYVYATGRVKAFSTFGSGANTQTPAAFGTAETDVFLVKYTPNGDLVWAKRPGGYEPDWGRAVAVDPFFNPVIVGDYCDTAYFGSVQIEAVGAAQNRNIFIAKYDSSGNCLWAKTAGNAANYSRAYGVTTDQSGNVYVTGHISGPGNFDGISFGITGRNIPFIAKFSPGGTCQWVYHINCQYGGEGYDIVYKNGKLFITGAYRGSMVIGSQSFTGTSPSWSDLFVTRMDTSGVFDWATTATGAYQDNPLGMAIDENSNVYVAGLFANDLMFPGDTIYSMTMGANATDANNYHGSFIAKYDQSGNFKWVVPFTSENPTDINDVAVTTSGKVMAAGYLIDTFLVGSTEFPMAGPSLVALVTCLDTSGNWMWNKITGTGSGNAAECNAVCTDTSNNIFTGGNYYGTTCYFDSFNVLSGAGWDAYTAKLYPPLNPELSFSDSVICAGDSVSFSARQDGWPVYYNWSFSGGNPSASIAANENVYYSAPGNYTATLIISNPVEADTFSLANITVNAPDSVNLGNDTSLCVGTVLSLDAGNHISYFWQDGSVNQMYSVNTAGVYSITVNSGFCAGKDTISVNYYLPQEINLGNDTLICSGQNLLLDPGTGFLSYLWQDGSAAQQFTVASTGVFFVRVDDLNGCSDTDTINVTVDSCMNVYSSELSDEVKLFPNPAHDVVNIELENEEEPFVFTLTDVTGKEVAGFILTNRYTKINIGLLAKGAYFYHIMRIDGKKLSGKLIIN